MNYYNIAGLNVEMAFKGETLTAQTKDYLLDEKPDIIDIRICDEQGVIEDIHKKHPYATLNDCEYMWTGSVFYENLLNFDGFMLHSSAVVLDGEAYLFSATSGTGKSTHTGLWLKVFGEKARILNDDKPAIRLKDDTIYAYGTPWSGKTDMNINECIPLRGICFLERSEENHISKISTKEAIGLILEQTVRPRNPALMDKLLMCIDRLLNKMDIYKMGCNMNDDAPLVSYEGMRTKG